jgi:hypothetical protein
LAGRDDESSATAASVRASLTARFARLPGETMVAQSMRLNHASHGNGTRVRVRVRMRMRRGGGGGGGCGWCCDEDGRMDQMMMGLCLAVAGVRN